VINRQDAEDAKKEKGNYCKPLFSLGVPDVLAV
jgi:hypothetical protein